MVPVGTVKDFVELVFDQAKLSFRAVLKRKMSRANSVDIYDDGSFPDSEFEDTRSAPADLQHVEELGPDYPIIEHDDSEQESDLHDRNLIVDDDGSVAIPVERESAS